MITNIPLQRWLFRQPSWVMVPYGALCALAVYCCMYAFRKPFTAAAFEGQVFAGVAYKVWLVAAQVVGYMLSKFYGIRFIAAMKGANRASTIVLLIVMSWVALLGFAVTPPPWNILFLLLNGFPLGLVWGLVFSFLEGRRATELMGAVLAVSFIFSSGLMKTVGKSMVLNQHISEQWMPFWAGTLFIGPLLFFSWLLHHLPPPTEADVIQRTERPPMNREERLRFLALFLPGLVVVIATYILLTVLRDFRDNFANELWMELGYGASPSVFTQTELPVSLVVLACMGSLMLVRNNLHAFMLNHVMIAGGYLVTLSATILFAHTLLSPVGWMIGVGTGLYISYIPFNCLFFDRMIATYRTAGNVGFLMYLADAFGYLASVAVLFAKEFWGLQLTWTQFFMQAIWIICTAGVAGTAVSALYFRKRYYTLHHSPT
jgi:hypothetical protein